MLIQIPKVKESILPVDNIRPISLTSVVGKFFKKNNKRFSILSEKLKWIPNFQKGFRKSRNDK